MGPDKKKHSFTTQPAGEGVVRKSFDGVNGFSGRAQT